MPICTDRCLFDYILTCRLLFAERVPSFRVRAHARACQDEHAQWRDGTSRPVSTFPNSRDRSRVGAVRAAARSHVTSLRLDQGWRPDRSALVTPRR